MIKSIPQVLIPIIRQLREKELAFDEHIRRLRNGANYVSCATGKQVAET